MIFFNSKFVRFEQQIFNLLQLSFQLTLLVEFQLLSLEMMLQLDKIPIWGYLNKDKVKQIGSPDAVELVNGKDDDTTDEDAAAAAALAKAPGRGLLSVCPANEIQQ